MTLRCKPYYPPLARLRPPSTEQLREAVEEAHQELRETEPDPLAHGGRAGKWRRKALEVLRDLKETK